MTSETGTPFRGLGPFEERHAPFFSGRTDETQLFGANLRASRLTILYGPSGVGKSSVLQAGVQHDLRDRAVRERAARDEAAILAPGLPRYVAEMAVVVFRSWRGDPVPALVERLHADAEAAAGRRLEPWNGEGSPLDALRDWTTSVRQLLVILDQFEEFFTYHAATAAGGLGRFLAEVLADPDLRVNVLISLREDALASLDAFKGLIPGLYDNRLRMDHLKLAAARDAIVGPVGEYNKIAGDDHAVDVEPELVEAILAAPELRAGALEDDGPPSAAAPEVERVETPYLELVLTRLWDHEIAQGSRSLRARTLEDLGGPGAIVERHLQQAIDALSPRERRIAAEAFGYLVTSAGRKITYSAAELAGPIGRPPDDIEPVLEKLSGDARILRRVPPAGGAGDDAAGPGTGYEIFHDVLGRKVIAWRDRYELGRARRRTLGWGLAAAAALLVAAFAIFAWIRSVDAREEATRQRDGARSLLLASESRALIGGDPFAALSAALRASEAADTPEAGVALRRALQREIVLDDGETGRVYAAEFSADGRSIVSAHEDGAIRVADPRGGSGRVALHGHASDATRNRSVTAATFSPDGRLIASVGVDGTVRIWDPAGGAARVVAPVSARDPDAQPVPGGPTFRMPALSVAFSRDGRSVVTAAGDGTVRVIDATSGMERAVLRCAETALDASFSSDGRRVVAGCEEGAVRVWEVRRARPFLVLRGHGDGLGGARGVFSASFSPDGRRILSGGADGTMRIWDAYRGSLLRTLPPQGADESGDRSVYSAAFDADGRRIVSAGADGTVRLWEPGSGSPSLALEGHGAAAGGERGVRAAFSRDGHRLVSAGADGTVRVWDVRSPVVRSLLRPSVDAADAEFSPDGGRIAAGATDGTVRVWDVASRRESAAMRGHVVNRYGLGAVEAVAFSPDGRRIASGGADDTVRVWSVEGGPPEAVLRGHEDSGFGAGVPSVAFSPDGATIASGGVDGTVRLWDPEGGPARAVLRPRGRAADSAIDHTVYSIAFSPDGRAIAAAHADGTVTVAEVASGRATAVLRGHEPIEDVASVYSVAFSPRGGIIASGGEDGTVRVWTADGDALAVLRGHGVSSDGSRAVRSVRFSADGSVIASAGADGAVRLWDPRGGAAFAVLGHALPVRGVAVAPDGTGLVTASADGVGLWPCPACDRLPALVHEARERLEGSRP